MIDDEPPIRGLFQAALERWGDVVDTAPSGAAGLDLFQRGAYGVVLTDYLLPGMTGFDVAVEMRRQAPNVHVILVTGSAFDAQLDAARQLNFTILLKPVDLADLKAAVDQIELWIPWGRSRRGRDRQSLSKLGTTAGSSEHVADLANEQIGRAHV